MTDRALSVLYVVYWGAAEPLGQSLVLPSVRRLARSGVRITLVTFDKAEDVADPPIRRDIATDLAAHDVSWVSLRYHKRPQIPAKLGDILSGVAHGLRVRLMRPVDIVHARTFVGGLMGLALASVTRAPLVYHNEGFYPDEQVDGGVWALGSRPHRVARALESRLYGRAAGVIALSHRAKAVIEALPAVQARRTPIIVVPSTVDTGGFRPSGNPPSIQDSLRLVYIGSVGRRYLLDRIGGFAAVAAREAGARLRVLTGADLSMVARTLADAGVPPDSVTIDSIPHTAMPAELVRHHAGIFFLTQGLSEHGCSPTKIGEYWACGLPVVTTPNVSDTDGIVRRERVGVVVTEHSAAGYRKALDELRELLRDPDLAARCRLAAERHYGLEPACDRQIELYRKIAR